MTPPLLLWYNLRMTNPHANDRTIRELIIEAHATAKEKGWWSDYDRNVYEQIALMHSELSEALEELRDGHPMQSTRYNANRPVSDDEDCVYLKPEGFLSELADLYIRVADTIGRYGLTDNFLTVLEEKLRYNKHRPFRHGGKQA